jgi:asparagine synthase (glutamine-hydrolysing)
VCGLAGLARIGAALGPDAEQLLRRMSRTVAHRGPDGEQVLLDDRVGLAFRRLALVGPESGDQPLHDEAGTVALIANGEVYNHRALESGISGLRLRTQSDCEVLAHLYARDELAFLDRVNGMYAIALHDRRRGRLVMARDRFGIKPLYYARFGDTVVFASEIKALFQAPGCPREVDWSGALDEPLLHGGQALRVGDITTWFSGIKAVPAGAMVVIDLADGSERLHRYWEQPDYSGDGVVTDQRVVEEYRELLSESVAQCASADAEIGLFLSGGIDSAAVAALAAGQGRKVHTFTVCTPSTVLSGDAGAAKLVADHLGLPNTQLTFPSGRVPTVAEWRDLLWLLETPLCSPAQYFTHRLYRHAVENHPGIKGMMLGQASDEYNGGYSEILSPTGDWAGFEAVLTDRLRMTAGQGRTAWQHWRAHTDAPLLADALLTEGTALADADAYDRFIQSKYRDIQQYNLWHEDRTAAGSGVEARVPFLDHRIIELMARVAPADRAALLWDKEILRTSVAGLLPEEIIRRRKVSFYHDRGAEHTHRVFVRMLLQDGAALLEAALAAPGARTYLNPAGMRDWMAALAASPTPTGVEFLLRLVNLGLLDTMVRDLPRPPVEAPVDLGSFPIRPEGAALDDEAAWELCELPAVQPEDLIGFADGVDVVSSITDPGVVYIAVNGQFEYVIAAESDPDWHAAVRQMSGDRTLAEVLALSSVDAASIAPRLAECAAAGLLTVTAAPAPVAAGG